ncbi:crotonase/enoyl-CoA hydratase family protein [Kineosporia rhizophila]|uniref:crotonase/enoyl-CoA hydratase family protein n=1 Tax=Kineosporia rhizophila TaxID=84633 RepID=UPI001E45C191|nr:crotonase/enoyl-CoA hydratase family protein [Kineosporia rhizophila]MCE0534726.1 crotonase/enoyl-CoA hydratase family protein [Kineosporia rhizophila]
MTEATEELVSLRVRQDGPVAEVTLVGPGKGNLLGPDFWAELPRVFAALDQDESVRAVVLTGAGGTFSYGLDLGAFAERWRDMFSGRPGMAGPRTELHDEIRAMQDAVTAVAECRKPVAAAVSGWCIGGGVDVIAACDVRYASAEARFSVREVRMAIVADLGSLHRLPAIIGEGHLRELALTGKDVDAARAERIGLVNEVLPGPDEALEAARRFAGEVAANPPLTVQGVKRVLDAERASKVQIGLKHVAAWNAAFMSSEDLIEAVAAFTERRRPEFTGR